MDVAAGALATAIPAFGPGRMIGMALAYLVQHGEKEPLPGDPRLTPAGRQLASRTGRWLHGRGVDALYSRQPAIRGLPGAMGPHGRDRDLVPPGGGSSRQAFHPAPSLRLTI
jgi:hypothetical protein